MIADYIGSKPRKPRICKLTTNRENHEASTSIDFYRFTVGEAPVNVLKGLSVIPSSILTEQAKQQHYQELQRQQQLTNRMDEFRDCANVY